ncbi:MAG TPA: PaaI family thioesterase, partial [Giesbergeria sp.]|nr:PaaI family thioesterase [Giesbergeria sp.]
MTLLDVAMATAARSHAPEMGVVTVEMKTSFMQPAQGPLVARGRLLHRTATLAFTEATVHDAQGRLCCQATGTFKVVRRLPVDGRQVHVLKAVPTD